MFACTLETRLDPNAEDTLMIALDELKVASSIGSLMAQAPNIQGRAVVGGSPVDFEAETELQEGLFKLNTVEVETESFPFATVADVLAGSMGLVMGTTGGIDSSVRMDLSKGLREADGSVELKSRDLVITDLEIPMMGPLGQQIIMDDFNVEIDIDKGKAKFDKGRIESDAVSVDLEGEISLREPFERSTLKLDAVLELGEAFSMVERFIASAKWDDDRYHYTISGTIGRPSFRPARQPSSRGSIPSTTRRPTSSSSSTSVRPSPSTGSATDGPSSEISDELEERRARRDEMRRRLSLGRPMSDAIRSVGADDDEEFEANEEFEGEEDFEGEDGEEEIEGEGEEGF